MNREAGWVCPECGLRWRPVGQVGVAEAERLRQEHDQLHHRGHRTARMQQPCTRGQGRQARRAQLARVAQVERLVADSDLSLAPRPAPRARAGVRSGGAW
jgi:hypothetical protein